jgi:ribosomal protein S18 acetylase RimI-like enzyme
VNEIVQASSARVLAPLPEPRVPVTVRAGTLADIPFIDSLQKTHAKMVGFMPAMQLEGKVNAGHVLVAEDGARQPVGYCIGQDRYFKHDDVGIIYHLNVAPGRQRGFVGATLLRALFDRAAYGCKLFCCWCAQDIEANRFWESMGFVPLAFRAGSEKKGRVHIFWQKRIRAGDAPPNATPWWFPAKTDAGAMREDRLVLPIPPGLHWSDEMPVLRPAETALPDKTEKAQGKRVPGSKSGPLPPTPLPRARARFGPPSDSPVVAPAARPAETPKAKGPRQKKKADPKLVAAARELRDRWLERVNSGEHLLEGAGKYDCTRQWHLSATAMRGDDVVPLLPSAA